MKKICFLLIKNLSRPAIIYMIEKIYWKAKQQKFVFLFFISSFNKKIKSATNIIHNDVLKKKILIEAIKNKSF